VSRKPRSLILRGSDYHRAGSKEKAGKENLAAERGRGPEAGVAEDFFFTAFPLVSVGGRAGRRVRVRRRLLQAEDGGREGSGAVSCESETNEAFLLTPFLYLQWHTGHRCLGFPQASRSEPWHGQ